MTTNNIDPQRLENLGPAERLIQTLLTHSDHAVHNRPGVVTQDPHSATGVKWEPATWKLEGPEGQQAKVVYKLSKSGKKTVKTKLGLLSSDSKLVVNERGQAIASYRQPGIFPEVAAWMWRQIAEVWKMDNEFAARWASHAFREDHKDLKVALAAFMLVQSRYGEPVRENGKIVFYDDDYRAVGEAMVLIRTKDADFSPKLLLRIHELLSVPQIAQINRELGFGTSTKRPTLGRWPTAVHLWLEHREQNPKLLQGLVKAGFRTTVMALTRKSGYKPKSSAFFQTLRWKQEQNPAGHRSVGIGETVTAAEDWSSLTEAEICAKIVKDKPNWKRICGLLPPTMGTTRAIMAAATEAGSFSNADLLILTPTFEELGLLNVEPVKSRWEKAIKEAEDQRASNIASRVKKAETVQKLQEAADNAVKKAVEEVIRGLTVYFFLDISGSMQASIEQGKKYISQFLQGFPLEKLHVATFNTTGREVTIKHSSSAGVEQAFRGILAGGGTDYGAGVMALRNHRPSPGEDALFIFVGDEQAGEFSSAVRTSGLNPVAFGLLKVSGNEHDRAVRQTAQLLSIPCFRIDENIFSDPYAVTRTLRNLIAATPVSAANASWGTTAPVRVSLVEKILQTDLLTKPTWSFIGHSNKTTSHQASAK